MKYNLVVREGRYSRMNGFETSWDFEFEGTHVHAKNIYMVETGLNGIGEQVTYIFLHSIPARVDVEDNGTVWVMDDVEHSILRKPYHTNPEGKSKTIWEKGEREAVTLEEVGGLLQ